MDIRKWLAETESSVPFERLEDERFLLPDPAAEARRERQRSLSDSSLLEILSSQPQSRDVPTIERNSSSVQDGDDRIRSDTPRSVSGEPSDSRAPGYHFSRRRRHKTRSDKYGARSKSRRPDEGRIANQNNEPRRFKRKSKHIADYKSHNGIGQDFQARNVSKGRLTVSVSHVLQNAGMLIIDLAQAAG